MKCSILMEYQIQLKLVETVSQENTWFFTVKECLFTLVAVALLFLSSSTGGLALMWKRKEKRCANVVLPLDLKSQLVEVSASSPVQVQVSPPRSLPANTHTPHTRFGEDSDAKALQQLAPSTWAVTCGPAVGFSVSLEDIAVLFICKGNSILLSDSRPLPDVALTGKCTRECDEYGHSDSCWMPVRTSPERKQKSQPKLSTFMPVDERGSQEKLANGEASLMGDRNRNLLNKKLTSSYETFSAASFSKKEEGNPEDIPLTQTGEYKPSPVNTLTRREVYL
ncbi:Protocadherin-9 [Anas platyrhynchos]|uniref:Protocadherin-9 n=1 Tax=Anas platyrhynchos TaxID=8839 RepID=R0LHL2_ANAPL|nr:Protocadherin-9 [Anas platyrhynchos]